MLHHTEEIVANRATIRADIISQKPYQAILEDETYLVYRLAGVTHHLGSRLPEPDLVWYPDEPEKSASYQGGKVTLKGEWFEGEIQKILVSLLATRMVAAGAYLFHASAVRYRDKTIAFLSGESNSGKTMSQIEACRRGGKIVSTETIVTDGQGRVIAGSKNVFLRLRAKGTERVDKPDQDEGVAKFFGQAPEFELYEQPTDIDLVIIPDIDGNFATMVAPMAEFEKQYQTFHCLCDYLGLHLLVSPGIPMPVFDSPELRAKRAQFIASFCRRPYYFIRAKDPQVLMDEVDQILNHLEVENQ